MVRNYVLVALCFSVCLMEFGCGGETGPARYPAAGTVSMDGAPLKNGRVAFNPVVKQGDLLPSAFANIKEGKYEFSTVDGPVEGDQVVYIMAYGDAEPAEEGEEPSYEELGQVKLTATVKSDTENKIDFSFNEEDLSDDPDEEDD